MAKPSLTVVHGAWKESSRWLAFPKTVSAPSPFDKTQQCLFRVAKEDAVKQARARRREPAFNFWSCIMGSPPPVNLARQLNGEDPDGGLSKLSGAHACFKGVKRPCGEDGDGGRQLAYILKPSAFYEYVPDIACVARKCDVPGDIVFVAYIRLDEPCTPDGHNVKGVLTHWHFVTADEANEMLPEEYLTRYDKRLW